jgi:hypothetical protein
MYSFELNGNECSLLKYYIKSKLSDISTYAIILSLFGAYFVASATEQFRLFGYITWIFSNLIWFVYFIRSKQYNPMMLFLIYLVTSIFGVYNNL